MPQPLRFGIVTDQNQPWPVVLERWQLFESLGYDSAWDCDHLIQPSRPTGPYYEAWTLLAALAVRTERIRVGVLVSCNTFRQPALLAKEAMTLDHLSNGRLDLGLGAGWYEPEHRMFGLDFPEPKELVGRFEEAVHMVDSLLRNDTTTYTGAYYQLAEAPMRPQPIQKPRPPFVLGAHRSRMLRIVAEFADTWNSFGTVEEMRERNSILDEHCAAIGRDPSEIVRSLYGWATMMPADPWASLDAFEDMVGRYSEAGVNEFLIDQPRDEQLPMLERVASELLPRLRGATGSATLRA
ncbi:MAG: TIGR03560 family F420-dependent LLM class oxidoreductase [Chloroflexi bacterium]|nr:TIGR03560 family F420-dependent LLM class oxidoreductase [Chloroflexota bacterium]